MFWWAAISLIFLLHVAARQGHHQEKCVKYKVEITVTLETVALN
jgi:hypothetical protein